MRGREHVGVLGVVVVVGAVEVGGHHGDIVRAVLTVEVFAVFEAGYLGEGVGFVGFLQFGGEKAALGHGLGCHSGVDAGGAEEFEFLAAVLPGGMDDVHLQYHVVVHEVGKGALVGDDAAYLGSGKEDVFGLFGFEEGFDLLLTGEVELLVGSCYYIGVALPL